MTAPIPSTAYAATFLRSFIIQGSWNYRTMIGAGFAFALLPVLRRLFASDREALAEAVRRHAEHFNAHPYLAGMALGAAARLEVEGEDPEVIRRFKTAVRGPLGSLGDTLVWAAWLPATLLAALAVAAAGAPPWVPVVLFLAVFNGGHLLLRTWGFVTGLREGRGVAERLGRARLSLRAERVFGAASLLLGAVVGSMLAGGLVAEPAFSAWFLPVLLGFALGARFGQEAWRPAVYGLMALIVAFTLIGILA